MIHRFQILALVLAVCLAASVAFGWAAWKTMRRFGLRGLVALWLGSATLAAGVVTLRIHQQQSAVGLSATQQGQFPVFSLFFPMWVLAFGAAAIVAYRARREKKFVAPMAVRTLVSFLAGVFAYVVIYIALDVSGVLGKSALDSAPGLAVTGVAATEQYELDLDGDGAADSLTLSRRDSGSGPGTFHRLEVHLSKGGSHTVVGSWDPPRPAEHPSTGNLISSTAMYVARFARAGTLVFLFGEDVGCCGQSLTIYRVTSTGLKTYFESREFVYASRLEPTADAATTLEGFEWLSQRTTSSAPNAARTTSYQPVFAIRLETAARVDTAESERRTRALLGGFAGLDFRDDIVAIDGKDGSRYLWDRRKNERIP